MKKEAINPLVLRGLVGTVLGGLGGYHVAPRVGGYEDYQGARASSTLINAVLGGMAGVASKNPRGAAEAFKKLPTMQKLHIPAAVTAGELVPQGLAAIAQQRESMRDVSQAGRELAESGKVMSIPYNIQKMLSSSTGKGVAGGAAAAGLLSLITGLHRRQSEEEVRNRISRPKMVGTDMLKYLLPAMLAGGVIGSLRNNSNA